MPKGKIEIQMRNAVDAGIVYEDVERALPDIDIDANLDMHKLRITVECDDPQAVLDDLIAAAAIDPVDHDYGIA